VSKIDPNENLDADILQCKADISRSQKVTPLHKEKTAPQPAAKASSSPKNEKRLSLEDIIPHSAETPAKPLQNEVPRFDLAEEIMAEYRKTTSTKRKSPGQKPDAQIEPPPPQTEPQPISRPTPPPVSPAPQPEPALLIPDQIIAEIVARDIERLCWNDTGF
jgi:hypothetical protein